jgi:predicted membrane chloride channel (bestrophin family)
MIDYDAKSWFGVVIRVRGSVGPRVIPRMLIAAGLGAAAAYLYKHHQFHTPAVATR